MSEGRTDGNGKSYYRENIEAATLSCNLMSNSHNEMTKLGINGFDTNDRITAAGYYNVMNIPEETLDNVRKVRFTLSLYQKNNDGGYDAVAIDEYLSDIQLYDKDGSAKAYSTDGGSYVFVFDRSELNYEAGSFEVIMDYSVKTGAAFERDKKLYSNYKVMLTAELIGQNDAPVENSGCSDYIVYTNAKIYSQMVSAK